MNDCYYLGTSSLKIWLAYYFNKFAILIGVSSKASSYNYKTQESFINPIIYLTN